jgi:hypothetical protein
VGPGAFINATTIEKEFFSCGGFLTGLSLYLFEENETKKQQPRLKMFLRLAVTSGDGGKSIQMRGSKTSFRQSDDFWLWTANKSSGWYPVLL